LSIAELGTGTSGGDEVASTAEEGDYDGSVVVLLRTAGKLVITVEVADVEVLGVETMLVPLMAVDMEGPETRLAMPSSTVTVTIATSVTVSIFVVRARRCARAWPWIPKLVASSGRPSMTTEIKGIRSEARILREMLLNSE
jgi:predicted deacylase